MEIFTYILSFIIGMMLGSFCTLAIHRIPLKQDIIYKHSYCPNCNHKLNFLDLIPIFSYIFLKGKCRYCNNKIRIRYLLIEILFGISFMLYTISIKLNILNLNLSTIIFYFYSIIYITILFIIAGIDKEKIQINFKVILCGLIFELLYIIYLCIYKGSLIYIYEIIYFLICLGIILVLTKNKSYMLQIILLYIYIAIYSGTTLSTLGLIVALLIYIIKNKILKIDKSNIPIGYMFSIINIVIIVILNFLKNYMIN